jgi:molybdopterin synthase catalytic subunit
MKGIRIRVLFLGPAGTLAGRLSGFCEIPESGSLGDLKRILRDEYPGLRNTMNIVRFAVNKSFTDDDTHMLRMGDEVALVPPVSGGSDRDAIWVELFADVLPAERARSFVSGDASCGAIVTFEGAVRDDPDVEHGPVRALHYEAYEEMAVAELRRIAERARKRWNTGRIAVLHRTGAVSPAEVSVLVTDIGPRCSRRVGGSSTR